MGLFKSIKKIAGFAAPIVGAAFGGPVGGAIGGALGGAVSGGGVKGILGGALGGYGVGGGGAFLGNALGVGGALGNALGSGALGAAGGALSGGGTGALIGGALGAGGGYIQGSGGFGKALDNVKSTLGIQGSNVASTGGIGGALGGGASSYGGDLYGALDQNTGASNGFLSNAKDYITGGVSPGPSDAGILSGFNPGAVAAPAASSSTNYLTPALSAGIGAFTNNRAEKQLLKGQQNAFNTLSPFLNSNFDASSLATDPGYQFQLTEGNKAIDRAASARGNYFSGQALTDAADYSKGLTDTTLNEAYSRYLNGNAQKIGVAGGLANIYGDMGNVRANATTNLGNVLTGSLAAVTGQQGVNSSGQVVGGNDTMSRLLAILTPQQRAQLGYA